MSEPGSERSAQRLRALPGVDRVLEALGEAGPPPLVADAARRAVDAYRRRILAGAKPPGFADVVALARELIAEGEASLLRPVLNATGVLIHTNLGRVPLGEAQLSAVSRIAGRYSNLEYDLPAGRRGSRYSHASTLLCALTGADAALVVNNNAAAVLLVLAALCEGREVVISRGELIEIGGEFRIPEVMAASGARLVEVGTTNRTHLGDYERAIGEDTAAVLKVHPSNYRVVGFTSQVETRELARLCRGRGVTLIHDAGSGLVGAPGEASWTASEPPVDVSLDEGVDVVTFSGDKLFGGPQAGVILARRDLIETISRHPLMRALRVDKMTLAVLEATVRAYLEGAPERLPLWKMAVTPLEELEGRARAMASAVQETLGDHGVKAEATAASSVTGGGSLPGTEISSWAVAVTHATRSPDELAAALRRADTPVIARIEDDRLLLDLRTVDPSEDDLLASLLASALVD